jgi:tRNA(Met) C34 N-acetyltransferase TmcA
MTRKKHDSKTNRELVRQRKRDAEKQASRDQDARDLESGAKTREQLWEENDIFSGVASVVLHKPKPEILGKRIRRMIVDVPEDLGRRTVQGVLIEQDGHKDPAP